MELWTVTIEFDELSAEQVDLIDQHPLVVGSAQPVVGLPLWRCQIRLDPPLTGADIATDVHFWSANRGIPFRKLLTG